LFWDFVSVRFSWCVPVLGVTSMAGVFFFAVRSVAVTVGGRSGGLVGFWFRICVVVVVRRRGSFVVVRRCLLFGV
jgi:hypothetical protein